MKKPKINWTRSTELTEAEKRRLDPNPPAGRPELRKYSDETVRAIRRLFGGGLSFAEIIRRLDPDGGLGLKPIPVAKIARRQTYRDVE